MSDQATPARKPSLAARIEDEKSRPLAWKTVLGRQWPASSG
jgi:hypothetical protein